ncbi:MAG: glycogen/starch synthase [Candidatus Cloacimonetes bacterium]|nr:glycogen/starch synthase [Candidatus Cloacimonadota bacterium]MCF7812989.1 glycogen/starch synthase [Candidatus Cloacimonadota bacterium]MCF7867279.1 glycogen/starch synthase [Candidatus Cloacimonadota bacterium]MCF7882723.1 glycogen/starch synthase [Candidatus Cloacimonadota bacterium]
MRNRNANAVNQEISRQYENVVTKSSKPKILLCTPEITELPEGMGNAANLFAAKGGGMGDISASLVRHLNDSQEFELHIVLPKYDRTVKQMADITSQKIDKLAVVLSGRGIHLVNDSAFSYLKNPYEENPFHSPIKRSLALQRHVINLLLDYIQPDVIHCNDWMTGLIPAAAKAKGIKTLFTLHNIFTEKQTMMEIESSGIRPVDFVEWLYFGNYPENIKETWPQHFKTNYIDFTATAIFASDFFNTVSETFLQELRENMFPEIVSKPIFEMIKMKCDSGRAAGILNAPNDTVNSKVMRDIINFNKYNMMEKKAENKKQFQEKMKLPIDPDIPIFFWPNRLYFQKGPDLLIENLDYFMKKFRMQIAVVANGDKKLEKILDKYDAKYKNISYMNFDESLSNLGKAAADFILMPSRYEPCGLPQMEAPRFGTLPIVRSTGGLKDTVEHLDVVNNTGNGFSFLIADKEGLEFGIREAMNFYALPTELKEKQLQRIMSESKRRFNLKNTAENYMQIYHKLIREKRDGRVRFFPSASFENS